MNKKQSLAISAMWCLHSDISETLWEETNWIKYTRKADVLLLYWAIKEFVDVKHCACVVDVELVGKKRGFFGEKSLKLFFVLFFNW